MAAIVATAITAFVALGLFSLAQAKAADNRYDIEDAVENYQTIILGLYMTPPRVRRMYGCGVQNWRWQ